MKIRLFLIVLIPSFLLTSTFGIYLFEYILADDGENKFSSLFNSLWWTVVTFTTVGYGDMSPVTFPGRMFTFVVMAAGLISALIIAIFIRSILIQPFYIPSSSMEPNLLVGDRLFVTKYTYGYSKHSFPFSPNIFKGRILFSEPQRGDVIVFKTPADNRTDYIKRLIGLPGDTI